MKSLSELRIEIDAIDAQILTLLNQRAGCALAVAEAKIAQGETGTFYRPDREASVLRRIKTLNENGLLSNDTVMRFFREIMSACLALEKPLEIAYLGPEGTFTQQATFKQFGHAVKTIPVTTINEVFDNVEKQHCPFGVVPIENSTEGVVTHTLDKLLQSPLKICGEVELRVHQNLLSLNNDFEKITQIYSHQQSLSQCKQWLSKNLPHAKLSAVSSNAEAAKLASQNDTFAAIAGLTAAEIYGLTILAENIEDETHNTTRFIVIGKQQFNSTGNDKTSLILSTHNQAGALYKMLEPFANENVDLLNIESRPSKQGVWDYVFFIDIAGHFEDKAVANVLAQLKNKVTMLKVLGSYPKAVF